MLYLAAGCHEFSAARHRTDPGDLSFDQRFIINMFEVVKRCLFIFSEALDKVAASWNDTASETAIEKSPAPEHFGRPL